MKAEYFHQCIYVSNKGAFNVSSDVFAMMNPLVGRPNWAEERRLREWLNSGGRVGGGRESFTVQCDDGRLSMTVDRHILQVFIPQY